MITSRENHKLSLSARLVMLKHTTLNPQTSVEIFFYFIKTNIRQNHPSLCVQNKFYFLLLRSLYDMPLFKVFTKYYLLRDAGVKKKRGRKLK